MCGSFIDFLFFPLTFLSPSLIVLTPIFDKQGSYQRLVSLIQPNPTLTHQQTTTKCPSDQKQPKLNDLIEMKVQSQSHVRNQSQPSDAKSHPKEQHLPSHSVFPGLNHKSQFQSLLAVVVFQENLPFHFDLVFHRPKHKLRPKLIEKHRQLDLGPLLHFRQLEERGRGNHYQLDQVWISSILTLILNIPPNKIWGEDHILNAQHRFHLP